MAKQKENLNLSIQDLKTQLEKKYGEDSVFYVNEKHNEEYDVISTGSLKLNIALGINGFPKGRIVEVYGWESSGKTTLCLETIAEATKKQINVAYIDAEHAYDLKYANNLGINPDYLLVSQPSSLENALNLAIDLVESKQFGVVVIDSLSSLPPQREVEGEVGDSTIGVKARIIGQFLRKITNVVNKNKVLLLLVGQLREKIGVMYGSPETTDYGNSVKFYASIRLKVSKTVEKDGTIALANKTKVKVEKNKCGTPFKTAEFLINYGEGIDTYQEQLDLALETETITKKGSWFFYNEMQLGQGLKNVADLLKDNPELEEKILSETLSKISNGYNF